jgi:hypothetical protein
VPKLSNVPDGVIELYDVVHDPGESRNLAGIEQGRVKELEDRLDSWWKGRE